MTWMEQINIFSGERIISSIFAGSSMEGLERCLEAYDSVFVVMDRAVAMECPSAAVVAEMMNRRGAPGMLVDASEGNKTIETVMEICAWLLEQGADRDALVLAVGGGITTDMAGFAASIYKRGVRFAFVPTTLLAQVDAAIGGKTGVNFDSYKNMLGTIRQPEFTYLCTEVLESLPQRDFMSGASEMLKTFIIEDGGCYAAAVDLLYRMQKEYVTESKTWDGCVSAYSYELQRLIAAAARVKAGVVTRDQFEKGERRKLNLGHTFAHAIETLAQKHPHDQGVTHGEAVAMGMVLAARLSDRLYADETETPRTLEAKIKADLLGCGIPCYAPFPIEDMAEIMAKDKKAEGGRIHFVLPKAIGEVTVCDMTVEEALAILRA